MSKYAYAALVSAAVSLVVPVPSRAQDAANATAGGDVTAEQATPLPPVVVEAPSQPLRAKKQQAKAKGSGPVNVSAAATGEAEGSGAAGDGVGVYTLGQLDLIGGATITNEAMFTFNKNTLEQAVNILPGVSLQNSGGSRNEKDIFVRGFDRYRVPLYMDGVRIYLPADNRLDMSRFLTPDLAEIQVQKGYVSVLNGPGGLGGAINMVSRKPTKEIELEGRTGATFDGDLGSMAQWRAYAYGGTRQKGYYAQVSGTIIDQDHFDLSSDFNPSSPTCTIAPCPDVPLENGGNRDRSAFEDWRVNVKAGITPNASDEYSINYTVQQGEKNAPLHVNRQVVQGWFNNPAVLRFWDWPEWDVSTLSWMSKTKLGDASYIKTNAYYNTFDNITRFFRDKTYTARQTDSLYRDNSWGGFVEMGTDLIPMNTLKGVIHYRRDEHNEHNINFNALDEVTSTDPIETSSEETWSFAVENTFHATRYLDIVTAGSYDRNRVIDAEDFTGGMLVKQAITPEVDAWNWQAAAIYSYSETGRVHADVSSRTRFPTLFERYSTRFGSKTANPEVKPERATNYEVGVSDTIYKGLQVSTAVFYSDIEDSIQNAYAGANANSTIVGFNADGHNYGFELSADYDATPTLRVGGNYTYLKRHLDFAGAALTVDTAAPAPINARDAVAASQVEGTPTHKLFLYLAWRATRQLTLTPSLEIAGDRNVLVTDCGSTLIRNTGSESATGRCDGAGVASDAERRPNYVRLGSYALVNFEAEYDFDPNTTLALGVSNLFDQNYALAQGFPEPGRMFFANLRAKF